MNAIDYSEIQAIEQVRPDEEWEAPPHKFFGKKLPNGKMEKEPVYQYQNFPAIFYGMKDGKISARMVNSAEEFKLLGNGWSDTPADFGLVTAPSFEQIHENKSQVSESEVEAPLARRGRPAKNPEAE